MLKKITRLKELKEKVNSELNSDIKEIYQELLLLGKIIYLKIITKIFNKTKKY
jgi:uncharacterized protein (UPF0335 family)